MNTPTARPARASFRLAWLLSLPAVLVVGALFLLPIAHLLVSSFLQVRQDGTLSWSLDLYRHLFADTYTLRLLARTLQISLFTVAASFLLAFPVALYMRQLSPRWRAILAVALLSPLLTSVVVRTLAWVVLLGPKGLLNDLLAHLGLPSIALMYNDTGVIIGLTHVYFGYMLLAVMTSVLKIDESLVLAASNLGASRWQVIARVMLPLSIPGIVAGSILVFTMSASAYVTPVLLGGTSTKVMATEIYDLAITYIEWREASALAVVLFVVVWLVVALAARFGDRGEHHAGVAR